MAKGVKSSSQGIKLNTSKQSVFTILLILVIIIWAFIHFYWDNPNRVFSRMLNNTLMTASYTKTITDYKSNQHSTQVISAETGAVNVAYMTQMLTIPGYSKGLIQIESIGTPTTDFERYTILKTPAKDSSGKLIDYSSALNRWGAISPGGTKATDGQLFNEVLLDVVPMANVNPVIKKQLLTYIKVNKVYTFSGPVSSQIVNGKPQLVYNVTVNMHYLQNYIKQFAIAIGLNQYNSKIIDASSLPKKQVRHYQFAIDSLTGQLSTIKYVGTNLSYKYSSYGAKLSINTPKKYIQLADLEKYIQQLSTK